MNTFRQLVAANPLNPRSFFRHAYQVTGNFEEALECTQEAFLTEWEANRIFDGMDHLRKTFSIAVRNKAYKNRAKERTDRRTITPSVKHTIFAYAKSVELTPDTLYSARSDLAALIKITKKLCATSMQGTIKASLEEAGGGWGARLSSLDRVNRMKLKEIALKEGLCLLG